MWFFTLGYQNGITLTSLTLFNGAPILSITLYLYNMLSNGDSHVLLPMDRQQSKNGNCINATHQHRMQQMKQQMMHNGNNNN